jgi:hypothetical protein
MPSGANGYTHPILIIDDVVPEATTTERPCPSFGCDRVKTGGGLGRSYRLMKVLQLPKPPTVSKRQHFIKRPGTTRSLPPAALR